MTNSELKYNFGCSKRDGPKSYSSHYLARSKINIRTDPNTPPTQRDLFRLFLPLALSGIFFTLARPLINAALARTQNPELALAALGVAMSITMPLMSPLFSLRQVATALVADQDMLKRIRYLSLILGSGSTALLLILSIPQIYAETVVQWMGIPESIAAIGPPILFVLALCPLLGVGRGYYQGILVHYNKAGPIGTGALAYLAGIAIILFIGITWVKIEGALLAATASFVGQGLYLIVVGLPSLPIIRNQIPHRSDTIPDEHRTNRYLFLFYLPMAVSTMLMAFIEPALQTSMARTAQPTHSLAAYAVAASLSWIARTPLWNAQQV
ncbi:MAG: hypothetical protein QGG64_29545 [Candidatus Latescibacteria bacterium]|nr:hypothetical protein [Candidatus Latescibacterota bacterium]